MNLDLISYTLDGFIFPLAFVAFLGFYWLRFRKRIPLAITGLGLAMYLFIYIDTRGTTLEEHIHYSNIFFGGFFFLFVGLLADGIYRLVRKLIKKPAAVPMEVSRKQRILTTIVLLVFALNLIFSNTLQSYTYLASQKETPEHVLQGISESPLLWYSDNMMHALVTNPFLGEEILLSLYEEAQERKREYVIYKLLQHEDMPCETVEEYMETHKDDRTKIWVVAMTERSIKMRCAIPEIYKVDPLELLRDIPAQSIMEAASQLYGEDIPDYFLEWIKMKQEGNWPKFPNGVDVKELLHKNKLD